MPNMSPKKNPMPSQDPHVRNKNYLEVATGYTVEMAQDEAARCLNCKHMPCVSGCPVNVKIPDFNGADVDFDELINRLATFKTEEEEKKDHACRFEQLGKDLIK